MKNTILTLLLASLFGSALSYKPVRGNYFYFSETETNNQQWIDLLNDITQKSREISITFNYNDFNSYIQQLKKHTISKPIEKKLIDSLLNIMSASYFSKINEITKDQILNKALNFLVQSKESIKCSYPSKYGKRIIESEYPYYKIMEAFKHSVSLSYGKQKLSPKAYKELMQPDVYVWRSKLAYNEPYIQYYLNHPVYRDYPVVGVSYNQILMYCKWVEDRINEGAELAIKKKNPWNNWQKVEVTLPTEKEWEFAARAGNKYAVFPWKGETIRNQSKKFKGQMMANYRGWGEDLMEISGNLNDKADITAPVFSYWPNAFGLYHMAGNVSEMVLEKGIIKGGAWKDNADKLKIKERERVELANNYTGFRIVVKILQRYDGKKVKSLKLNKKYFKKNLSVVKADTLYAGKYEVTNQLFREFCKTNKDHLPDTSSWNNLFPYGYEWSGNYFNHSDYANHPVVNVSKQSAKEFCKWLTNKYNSMDKREFKKVIFSLPNYAQWEELAEGGFKYSPYPWGYKSRSKRGFLCNHAPKRNLEESIYRYDSLSQDEYFKIAFNDLSDQDNTPVLANVDSYVPNGFDIYCAAGNAAEMILDSNVTKGGSWRSPSYNTLIRENHYFDFPFSINEKYDGSQSPFVGFRYVMEVIEK